MIKKIKAKQLVITELQSGQRIDNFLIRYFNNVPKSRVYQMIRKGEVRINKGRIKQTYKLVTGDVVRIPPVFETAKKPIIPSDNIKKLILDSIIYQDDEIVVLNKPANLCVHGGSGQSSGIIETIRSTGDDYSNLELVHRLDKDTSGCLILAKSIPVLRKLNLNLKNGEINKTYIALLSGQIKQHEWVIDNPLSKNMSQGGERIVGINSSGKKAVTKIVRKRVFEDASLVNVSLITGRTHQIRVHSSSVGHPVLGDRKYGNREQNRKYKNKGLRRIFLHASKLDFILPISGKRIVIEAPLSQDLQRVLELIDTES
ncbi:MAG: RluA family pseudouridine synthase [Proteobacteria bacterium]|nr:RluA family pseudouridine synthase [Pseudomonadota bacterium]